MNTEKRLALLKEIDDLSKEKLTTLYREVEDLLGEMLNPNRRFDTNEIEELFFTWMNPLKIKFSKISKLNIQTEREEKKYEILSTFFTFSDNISFDQIKDKRKLFEPTETKKEFKISLLDEDEVISLKESFVRS